MFRHFVKFLPVFLVMTTTTLAINNNQAIAHSVCGTRRQVAAFKTKSYLITICPGEASFQLILTYHDGTGYKRIPVQQEGDKYRGSDGNHNYIIDPRQFIIGTDGKEPIRQAVIEAQ